MSSRKRSRIGFIGFLTMAVALAVMTLPPIPQPEWYHAFADQRAWFGIPHFPNVVSNALFRGLGLTGLWQLSGRLTLIDSRERSVARKGLMRTDHPVIPDRRSVDRYPTDA